MARVVATPYYEDHEWHYTSLASALEPALDMFKTSPGQLGDLMAALQCKAIGGKLLKISNRTVDRTIIHLIRLRVGSKDSDSFHQKPRQPPKNLCTITKGNFKAGGIGLFRGDGRLASWHAKSSRGPRGEWVVMLHQSPGLGSARLSVLKWPHNSLVAYHVRRSNFLKSIVSVRCMRSSAAARD